MNVLIASILLFTGTLSHTATSQHQNIVVAAINHQLFAKAERQSPTIMLIQRHRKEPEKSTKEKNQVDDPSERYKKTRRHSFT